MGAGLLTGVAVALFTKQMFSQTQIYMAIAYGLMGGIFGTFSGMILVVMLQGAMLPPQAKDWNLDLLPFILSGITSFVIQARHGQ